MGVTENGLDPGMSGEGLGALRWLPDGMGGKVPVGSGTRGGRGCKNVDFAPDNGPLGRLMTIVAEGHDVIVHLPSDAQDGKERTVRMMGDSPGSLMVLGPGWGNAGRWGSGDGHAVRFCPKGQEGKGSARRNGAGDGNAVVSGNVDAVGVIRGGTGHGHALALSSCRRGSEAWPAHHSTGRGFSFSLAPGLVEGADDAVYGAEGSPPMDRVDAERLADEWGRGNWGHAVPAGVSRVVASMVAALARDGGDDALEGLADWDDVVDLAACGRTLEIEWAHLPLVMGAVREAVRTFDETDVGLAPDFGLAKAWRAFAASVASGQGGWRPDFERLASTIAAVAGEGLAAENLAVRLGRVAKGIACLEVVAEMDEPDNERMMAAAGYVRESLMFLKGWMGVKLDRGVFRAAVSEAALMAREQRELGPSR